MAIEGSVTLNELTIAEVDADPTTAGGIDLPIGSIATLGTGSDAKIWLKYGNFPTDWKRILQLNSSTELTEGSILFAGTESNVLENNAKLFWNNTSKKLGIGHNSPQASLHIDSGDATASALKFTAGTTTGQTATDGFDIGISSSGLAELRQRENLGLSIFTNNLERFAIEATGRTRVFGELRYNSLTEDITSTTTSASTLNLLADDTSIRVFTGTATDQIVRLPNATTLLVGRKFDIWNLSTQTITIQDNGGNLLTELRANGRTQCLLRNNSTANGIWALTYTLDNGNVFGSNVIYTVDETETSNSSGTVWETKLILNTPSNLTTGTYLLTFQFIWRAANANREADFRFRLNGTDIVAWSPSTGRTQDRQLLSGFQRITNLSGANTFDFQFKWIGSSTTIFVQQARMFLWRIG